MSAAGFSKISEREKKKFIWICVIKRITSIIAVAVTSKIPFFRTQSNIAAHMPRRLWHRQGKGERPLSPCLINRDLHLKEGWVNVMSIPVGGGENRERERERQLGGYKRIRSGNRCTLQVMYSSTLLPSSCSAVTFFHFFYCDTLIVVSLTGTALR